MFMNKRLKKKNKAKKLGKNLLGYLPTYGNQKMLVPTTSAKIELQSPFNQIQIIHGSNNNHKKHSVAPIMRGSGIRDQHH